MSQVLSMSFELRVWRGSLLPREPWLTKKNKIKNKGVPTLLYTTDSGSTYNPVPVGRFTAYYNLGVSPAEVAIPQDLKMTAGLAMAQTSDAMDADAGVEWFCEGDDAPAGEDPAAFPTSTCSTYLQTLVYFPDCVDEATLAVNYTSRDYGTDNWCPEGMKTMPQLRFSIRYDVNSVLPGGWSGDAPLILSSGTSFSSHGDFINGWLPEAATNSKEPFSSSPFLSLALLFYLSRSSISLLWPAIKTLFFFFNLSLFFFLSFFTSF